MALVEDAGKKNPDIAVKYASTVRSWQNAMKNYDGQLDGFRRVGAAQTEQADEAEVLSWLGKQGSKGEGALAAHDRMVQLGEEHVPPASATWCSASCAAPACWARRRSCTACRSSAPSPTPQREQGYQQRDLPSIEGGMKQMERRYDPKMDRELQAYWLREYVKLPAAQRVAAVDAWLDGNDEKAIKRALDKLAKTELKNADKRMALFSADRAAFEASKDPAVQFAVAIMPTILKLEQETKTRAGDALVAKPVYLQAMADYKKSKGQFVYPDANSSLRITFGNVTGYTKTDGSKQVPFTRLEEVAAKATGSDPFDAPPALLSAINAKRYGGLADRELGTVPVNFLSDLDITGGNSGSPVLDARGKLVGLAFDGNWESVSSNWVFDPTMTRMISVDQRYMRWIMQEVFPAPQLLKELNVAPKS